MRKDVLSGMSEYPAETPFLDTISKQGVYFNQAYSSSSWTVPAHASLFTGRYPTEHGVNAHSKNFDISNHETLVEILNRRGYYTTGYSTNPWITSMFGFSRGFDEFHNLLPGLPYPDLDPREVQWPSDTIKKYMKAFSWVLEGNPVKKLKNGIYFKKEILKYIRSEKKVTGEIINNRLSNHHLNQDNSPFFLFANYMDLHEPYIQNGESVEDKIKNKGEQFAWNLGSLDNSMSQESREYVRKSYYGEAEALDSVLEELVYEILGKDVFDNTLVIFLGDHGQSLGEGGYWGHGTFLYDELTQIPLIVSPPKGFDSEINERSPISITEVGSLILEYLGIESEFNPFHESKNDNIVFSETVGPHNSYDGDYIISEPGYRGVHGPENSFVRNISTNAFEFGQSTNALVRAENEFQRRKSSFSADSGRSDVSENIKAHLKNLGYR
jgi:arylsulfatase A-like enzyme